MLKILIIINYTYIIICNIFNVIVIRKTLKMTWQNLFSYKLFGVVKLLIHNRNRKNNIMKAFYKITVSAYITHESDLSFLAQIFEKKTQKPGRYYAMININIKKFFPTKTCCG